VSRVNVSGSRRIWTTQDEINFIRRIGRGNMPENTDHHTDMSRLDKLLGYIDGARQRQNWGGMDRNEVIEFAEAELEKENINKLVR